MKTASIMILGLLLTAALALPATPAVAVSGTVDVKASVRAGLEWSSTGPDSVDIRSNASWKVVATMHGGTETIHGAGSASNVTLPHGTLHYTILLD